MLVPQLTRPWSQFNDEHSNEMVRHHTPLILFSTTIMKDILQKPESRFVKRVNTCKGCWYHNWQDHYPSLMLSTQMKWQGITSPPNSVSSNNYEGPQAENLNLILSKRVNTHRGHWYHSWQDHGPSLLPSTHMKWQGSPLPPWFCFPQQNWRISSN